VNVELKLLKEQKREEEDLNKTLKLELSVYDKMTKDKQEDNMGGYTRKFIYRTLLLL
jgi:hypothetical protein